MPSKAIHCQSNPFVLALMDALGLPKHTVSFELRCALDEAATVRCTYFPQAEGVEGFDPKPLLAQYKLVPASAVTQGDPAEAFADEGTEPLPPPPGPEPRILVDHPWPSPMTVALGLTGLIGVVGALLYAFGVWP